MAFDLGCGDGTTAIPSGQRGASVLGVDIAANLVSAGVRLIPLGQTDGQRVLARLEPILLAASSREVPALDDIGGAAPLIDILSMRHETQYTRLFRS